jgi:hypothetical protein
MVTSKILMIDYYLNAKPVLIILKLTGLKTTHNPKLPEVTRYLNQQSWLEAPPTLISSFTDF